MENNIVENKELNIWEALTPVLILIVLLGLNVSIFGDNALEGSNQFILLVGAAIAAIVGFRNKVSYKTMLAEVSENMSSTTGAIVILLFVGSLSGTWLVSGIIPAMVYYGIQILNPTIFLPATVVICALISVVTGSSWTTSATVGIALIGIGNALGINLGMVAGAALSGAYFGDKLSPLSDTTNLAPAMAGGELFDHIRYMTYTTIPTITVAFVIFIILGLTQDASGQTDTTEMLSAIDSTFTVSPVLFIVPAVVILLIMRKTKPLVALMIGTLLGGIFAIIYQPHIIAIAADVEHIDMRSGYIGLLNAITIETVIPTEVDKLQDLFTSGGMAGMMGTIWLIICAMVFGGVMDAIGALDRITNTLLSMAKSVLGLFASTVASCVAINVTASDQYLSIVVPGKMFAKAYEDRGLAPENLSRTLEDSGTVTSVLIPWNTCGAYHSGVLGVEVKHYFVYAIFNYLSPFTTLIYAALRIKIKMLTSKN